MTKDKATSEKIWLCVFSGLVFVFSRTGHNPRRVCFESLFYANLWLFLSFSFCIRYRPNRSGRRSRIRRLCGNLEQGSCSCFSLLVFQKLLDTGCAFLQ